MMKKTSIALLVLCCCWTSIAGAWQARVVNILHHNNTVAIYLSPDPGPGICQAGSPYLLTVDESAASKERFAMIMTALVTGRMIGGYHDDGCAATIWAESHPLVQRLYLGAE